MGGGGGGGAGGGASAGASGGDAGGFVVDIDESKIPSIAAALKVPVDVVMTCVIAKGKLDLAALNLATGLGVGALKTAIGSAGALIGMGTNMLGAGINMFGNAVKGFGNMGGGSVAPKVTDMEVGDISKTLEVPESKVKGAMTLDGGLDMGKLASSTGKSMSSLMGALGGMFGENFGFGKGGSESAGGAKGAGGAGSAGATEGMGGLFELGSGAGGAGGAGGSATVDIDESKIPDIAAALKVPVDVVMKCLIAKGKLDLAALNLATGISVGALKTGISGIGALIGMGANMFGAGMNMFNNAVQGFGNMGGEFGFGGSGGMFGSIIPKVSDSQVDDITKKLDVNEDDVKDAMTSDGGLDLGKLADKTGKSKTSIMDAIGGIFGKMMGGMTGNMLGNIIPKVSDSQVTDISKDLDVDDDDVKDAMTSDGGLDMGKLADKTGKSMSAIMGVMSGIFGNKKGSFGFGMGGPGGTGGAGGATGAASGNMGQMFGPGGRMGGGAGGIEGFVVDIDESKIPSIAAALKVPVDVVIKCLIAKGKLDLAALNLATGLGMGALKTIIGGAGALIGIGANMFGAGMNMFGNAMKGFTGMIGNIVPKVSDSQVTDISKDLDVSDDDVKDAMTSDGGLDLGKLADKTGKSMSAIKGVLSGVFGKMMGGVGGGIGDMMGNIIPKVSDSQVTDISKDLDVDEDDVKDAMTSDGGLDLGKLADKTGKSMPTIVGALSGILNLGGSFGFGMGGSGGAGGVGGAEANKGLGGVFGFEGGMEGGAGGAGGSTTVDIDESKIPDIAAALKVPVDVVMKCLVAKGKLDLAALNLATGIGVGALKAGISGMGALIGMGANMFGAGMNMFGNAAKTMGSLINIPIGIGAAQISQALSVPEATIESNIKDGSLDVESLSAATGKAPADIMDGLFQMTRGVGVQFVPFSANFGAGVGSEVGNLGSALGDEIGGGGALGGTGSAVTGLTGGVGRAVGGLGGLGGRALPIAVGAGGGRYYARHNLRH
ncbi:hypothetical protein L596_028963 [Steinernema carpocapsae]|uniref:Uncharacterized protein n=1 Tax=Steinernema carpocapsae TaxID=34508 RepID=A0A4U5LT76_STECR|nr:hypothetical protein L596_028963 [Steinernema carpocapsae]